MVRAWPASASESLTLGIDEAGRGPSIGPMVMAAVALDSKAAASLTRKGLRDSKAYGAGDDAHAIRSELAREIRERAMFVRDDRGRAPRDRRRACRRNELNVLEREIATRLIEPRRRDATRSSPTASACSRALALRYPQFESRRPRRGSPRLGRRGVGGREGRSATSAFNAIRARYEPELGAITGGGYANAATRRWVRAYVERYGKLPDERAARGRIRTSHDLIGDTRPPAIQRELFED